MRGGDLGGTAAQVLGPPSGSPQEFLGPPAPPSAPSSGLLCLGAPSCLTLCDPLDCSSPGSSVHGDSPGQNTGLPCLPPGDLPNPGIEPGSPALQAGSLLAELPGKPQFWVTRHLYPGYGTAGATISRFVLRSVCMRR